MYWKTFVNNAIIVIAIFVASTAEPLRNVVDIRGEAWEEYFDENTQHFYYYHPKTKTTSWLLEFSSKESSSWSKGNINNEGDTDIIDEIFPVLSKAETDPSFEALKIFPVDIDEIHLRKDLAGRLHTQNVKCMFDHLLGVKARVNFPMALKAPVAFHHMFISDESRQENVAKERIRIELKLANDPTDAESWEILGHIWRVYGHVHRSMDCYRRALQISPLVKTSFYVNIAGLLDQMNYVQDALEVLNVMMNSFDPFILESESNLGLGYVMAASLHIRNRNKGNLSLASAMLDASIELHPQFYSAVLGLRQEIHYMNNSLGGPPWLFGGSGAWIHLKNPFLITDMVAWACGWLRLHYFIAFVEDASLAWPRLFLYMRKCLNAFPTVLVGLLMRYAMIHGAYMPIFGLSVPLFIPMSLCIHLTLSTEYLLTDCVLLIFTGWMVSYEGTIERVIRQFHLIDKKN